MTEPVKRVEHTWAGLRTFAPDRQLVIGFDRNEPGFFWHAGQGGYGMQTSPAASRLAADLISGGSPEIDLDTVAALSPARFGQVQVSCLPVGHQQVKETQSHLDSKTSGSGRR